MNVEIGVRRHCVRERRFAPVAGGAAVAPPTPTAAATEARAQDGALVAALLAPLCGTRAGSLASDLLASHGSIPGLLRANPATLAIQLSEEPGVAALLQAVHPLMRAAVRAEMLQGPILPDLSATLDHLFLGFAHEPAEQVVMLYLDAKNRLLAEEIVARGTVTRADIFPREVVRRALDLGATGLIMAHNHPSGDPAPSRSDLEATRAVAEAARLFDIALHDHIVIARGGHCSLRDQGYL